jgi:hypothetical protein
VPRCTNVPQSNAFFFEQAKTVFIRQARRGSCELPHDAPEGIPRLSIILAVLQRYFAR